MLQTDSTELKHQSAPVAHMMEEPRKETPAHPYEALSELPRNATPVQQDSVLRTIYNQPTTGSRPSGMPDTLSILNSSRMSDLGQVEFPQYYKQTFFSSDSLLKKEIGGGRYGVAGDPVPYTIREDNMITGLLIGCFILAFIALSKSKWFIMRQAKNFFRVPRRGTTSLTETTDEFRFQFFLAAQTCLLLSLLTFFYAQEYNSDTFLVSSQYQLIALFFGVFVGYFSIKAILYSFVNWVFFSQRQNEQWMKSYLFLVSVEGVAMFPFVVSQAYFGLSVWNTILYVGVIVALAKMLTLYKGFLIFFKQKSLYVQIFLYFCALEIIPLLALCGVLTEMISYLNINF